MAPTPLEAALLDIVLALRQELELAKAHKHTAVQSQECLGS